MLLLRYGRLVLKVFGIRFDMKTPPCFLSSNLNSLWFLRSYFYAIMRIQCIRCLRQTSAFSSQGATSPPNQTERETWWISRWAYCCPMCGGTWVRVV